MNALENTQNLLTNIGNQRIASEANKIKNRLAIAELGLKKEEIQSQMASGRAKTILDLRKEENEQTHRGVIESQGQQKIDIDKAQEGREADMDKQYLLKDIWSEPYVRSGMNPEEASKAVENEAGKMFGEEATKDKIQALLSIPTTRRNSRYVIQDMQKKFLETETGAALKKQSDNLVKYRTMFNGYDNADPNSPEVKSGIAEALSEDIVVTPITIKKTVIIDGEPRTYPATVYSVNTKEAYDNVQKKIRELDVDAMDYLNNDPGKMSEKNGNIYRNKKNGLVYIKTPGGWNPYTGKNVPKE